MPWFTGRRAVAEQEQHRLWKQARLKTDIQFFISKLSEIEVVDAFNAIERHLAELQVTFDILVLPLKTLPLILFGMFPSGMPIFDWNL